MSGVIATLTSSTKSDAPNLLEPQSMVTVHIVAPRSETKTTFLIHKNFICKHSPYFEAAFDSKFLEGIKQELELDDTDPVVFGVFVNWLYTQKITVGPIPGPAQDPDHYEVTRHVGKTLMNLWLLADRVLVPKLQNQTLTNLDKLRIRREKLPGGELRRVYYNTSVDSPLRRYIVDTWCSLGQMGSAENYPHAFLFAVVESLSYRGVNKTRVLSPVELESYFVNEESAIGPSSRRKDLLHSEHSSVDAVAEGVQPRSSTKRKEAIGLNDSGFHEPQVRKPSSSSKRAKT